jgi:hypothetical protein
MDAKFRTVLAVASGLCLAMASGNALAQTRSYQMTIYPSVYGTSASMDIPMFTKGVFVDQVQPPGRSILWLRPNTQPAELDQMGIAWARIAAVYVDEPYYKLLKDDPSSAPWLLKSCTPPGQQQRRTDIVNLANAVRDRAPAARFWVNFNDAEIFMIMNRGCSYNESYIDVISIDYYWADFDPSVRQQYEYIYTHRPTSYQQLALVVPVFTGGTTPADSWRPKPPTQTTAQAVARLPQYLAYAAEKNQTCNLPLGLAGATRIYDGCPVWAVAGFKGGEPPNDDTALLPIDTEASLPILNKWQEKFSVQRIDPTQVRRFHEIAPTLFSE